MVDNDSYLNSTTPDATEIPQAVWDILYPVINPNRRFRFLRIYGGGVLKYDSANQKVTMSDTLRIMFQHHLVGLGADTDENYIINEIFPDNGSLATSVGQHYVIYAELDPATANSNISNSVTAVHYSNFDGDGLDTGNIIILGITDEDSFYTSFIDTDYIFETLTTPLSWSKIISGIQEMTAKSSNSTLSLIGGNNIDVTLDDGAQSITIDASPDISYDHGILTGLDDDDHVHYLLANGSRDLSGTLLPSDNSVNLGSGSDSFGAGYFQNLTVTNNPTSQYDVVNKGYLEMYLAGLEWQDSVIDFYDPSGGLPGSPSTGDRYIATATANGWVDKRIYEWDGSVWDDTEPTTGTAVTVDSDGGSLYVFNGTNWVKTVTPADHGSLSGLTDDDHTQYLLIDGTRGMTGNLEVNEHWINGDNFTIRQSSSYMFLSQLTGALPGGSITLYKESASEYGSVDINTALAEGVLTLQIGYSSSYGSIVLTQDYATIDDVELRFSGGQEINEFSTDGTLADNSDTALPTEKAVKTYADWVMSDFLSGNRDITGDISIINGSKLSLYDSDESNSMSLYHTGDTNMFLSNDGDPFVIQKGAVSNIHYDDFYTTAIIDPESRLQIISENSGAQASSLILSNVIDATDNRHWYIHQNTSSELEFGYEVTTGTNWDIVGSGDVAVKIFNNGNVTSYGEVINISSNDGIYRIAGENILYRQHSSANLIINQSANLNVYMYGAGAIYLGRSSNQDTIFTRGKIRAGYDIEIANTSYTNKVALSWNDSTDCLEFNFA